MPKWDFDARQWRYAPEKHDSTQTLSRPEANWRRHYRAGNMFPRLPNAGKANYPSCGVSIHGRCRAGGKASDDQTELLSEGTMTPFSWVLDI
jgi:hypothetical protein